MEYVVQLQPVDGDVDSMDATLVAAFDNYSEQLAPNPAALRARGQLEEFRGAGDRLLALRDNLGLTNEKFLVHVCLHDEGVGACIAVEV